MSCRAAIYGDILRAQSYNFVEIGEGGDFQSFLHAFGSLMDFAFRSIFSRSTRAIPLPLSRWTELFYTVIYKLIS